MTDVFSQFSSVLSDKYWLLHMETTDTFQIPSNSSRIQPFYAM
jgi:hypothetical protein